ncbi:MAG: hypothetical protein K6G12_03170 [Lachnospiraceae bacterium]|nr:hypothetical protein [Lachnospiraceae bacterium]
MNNTKDQKRKQHKKKPEKKNYILLMSVMLTVAVVTLTGLIGMPSIYASPQYDLIHTPTAGIVMQGLRNGIYPWKGSSSANTSVSSETGETSNEDIPVQNGDTDLNTASSAPEVTELNTDAVSTDISDADATSDSLEDTDAANAGQTDVIPEEAEPERTFDDMTHEFITVDDDYFNDALFVGDSRMVGLSQYCEPIDERADFYVKKALTIFNLLDGKQIRSFDGTQKSLWEVLEEKNYSKIYIMVGINEIGVGNSEYFKDAYSEVVDRIRQAQPEAIIFINGIMHVSSSKSATDQLYNNTNINVRNEAIKTLADNIRIYYIDVNEVVDDEAGGLRADLTFDDIHLKGSSYEPWHEFLLNHGIDLNEK